MNPAIQPSAPSPGAGLPPAQLAKMAKAARDFEANAINQLLAPMFNTVDLSKTAFGGGAGESTWRPMMVTEIAKNIASGRGIGLAQPVLAQMIRMQEARFQEPA